jgi:hypothetical protein
MKIYFTIKDISKIGAKNTINFSIKMNRELKINIRVG